MKFIVIGLGSMGQRRIRCLKQLGYLEIVGYDLNAVRRKEICGRYSIMECHNLADYLENSNITALIVSTSPLQHGEYILAGIQHQIPVFSELDLVSDYYEPILSAEKTGKIRLFLSSTFLYRAETQYIIERLKEEVLGKRVFYTYHVGQYLPDWHKWESYKDFFVAKRRTNALRELLVIEFPWLVRAFGEVVSFTAKYNKVTELELAYPDTLHLILEHQSGATGQLTIDLVSRISERNMSIYGEKGVIGWRGKPESLFFSTPDTEEDYPLRNCRGANFQGYADHITEEPYVEEVREFISGITEGKPYRYSFAENYRLLQLIEKIEVNMG